MLNEESYKRLEKRLEECGIAEEAEDVLLTMAEALADKRPPGDDLHHSEKYGRTLVEVCGDVALSGEGPEDVDVFVKWIRIGSVRIEINDYLL